MDTVWVDTMFPGLDPDEGWEKNLERVVNYDYLLKEYLDWQLKHLTTDNFNPTDWANVTADIISMAAQSVDLTAYYTKDEADNKSQLLLQAAEDYTQAQLASYYTANEVDSAISTQAGLTLTTAEGYTNTALGSYYTKTEIGDFTGYQTAVAALQAYANNAVANVDLTAAYTYTDNKIGNIGNYATIKAYADAQISGLSLQAVNPEGGTAHLALMSGNTELGSGASLGLSVTNNSNGYSYVKLKSGNIDLATSGNITLGGNVVFASGSGTTKNLSYTTISGGTVTTNTISALNVTANTIKASASISSPAISGGTITGNTISSSIITSSSIYASNIYAASNNDTSYMKITSSGWEVYTNNSGTAKKRAYLEQSGTEIKIVLGDTAPYAYVEKYQSNNTDYMWIGGGTRGDGGVGIRLNLDSKTYKIFGTAE